MARQPQHRNEDPAATHARLSAAALASHANACAAADAFLAGGAAPDPERMPPDLALTGSGADRAAVIGNDTPDERRFTSREALREYVRTFFVMTLTVRRNGWTAPDPADPRIQPDTARLLLHPGNPLVDIVARIGMDGSLDAPQLRYDDEHGRMQRFDHDIHELDEQGVPWVASLFTI